MKLELQKITEESQDIINQYAALRPICITEGHFLSHYIWCDYYDTSYYAEDDFLIFFAKDSMGYYTMLPLCKEETLIPVFHKMEEYFHQELHLPFRMSLLDRLSMGILQGDSTINQNYRYVLDRDTFDYVYDADKLRTLSGKKLHKKKNHLNQFMKTYEGRFEYRPLDKSNLDEIMVLYEVWSSTHKDGDLYDCKPTERSGIYKIFKHFDKVDCKMGGVYIDGKLQAFSIGSYSSDTKCAYIHIEKANIQFPGLYNYINQQFLIHAFPEAKYVNREDDLGQPGLRHSKLSYKPLFLAEKYYVKENCIPLADDEPEPGEHTA